MNTQDILHQAQDAFDRMTHRTSPLLPVHMDRNNDSPVGSSSGSALANVPPPSALPSFITSPRPAAPVPTPPSGPPPSVVSNPASANSLPGPPSGPGMIPPQSFQPPGSMTYSSTNTTVVGSSSGAPIPSPESIPMPQYQPAPTGGPSPPPVRGPTPLAPSASSSVPPSSTAPGSYVLSPVSGTPITSQPMAPPVKQNSITLNTKGHSRHHSYPLYVPGNPMHIPPPAPTPPCLAVHQEQMSPYTMSKSYNHLDSYTDTYVGEGYYGQDSRSVHMNLGASNVSFGYGYASYSQGSVDTSAAVDLGSPGVGGPATSPGGNKSGWLGWIRGTVSNVGHRVAEKAKNSMDTMITTLDPQMKEFIHSGGDMDIIVASDKEVKVGAVRESFQHAFGKATVTGMAAPVDGIANQPVGFEAALQSAEGRINALRSSGKVHPQQPIVSVENFIVELTPNCWYDIGLLLLDDPGEDIILQTYTQVTPVPPDFVNQARAATAEDYPFRSTGFSTTVGQIASQNLQVHHTLWQETLTGVPRRDMIAMAARSLAGLYKARLPPNH